MKNLPKIKSINYVRSDGMEKTANIIPVEFPTEDLSQEELAVLANISKAVNYITPIYVQQQDAGTFEIMRTLKKIEKNITDPEEKIKLDDYITLLAVKNSPVDDFDFGMRFPIESSTLDEIIEKYPEFLSGKLKVPPGRGLYPADITDEEFNALSKEGKIENSTVIRLDDRSLKVLVNEERFKQELKPVIKYLKKAMQESTNEDLNRYLTAKIHELRTGTPESRTESEIAWLKNSGSIDFVLSTAVEVYLDKFKGVRGTAQAVVCIIDKEYESISSRLLKILPQWEATAPWKYKKKVNTANLPKLNYVNIVNWSGSYNVFPLCVVAESLPNSKEIKDKYGSANLIFTNIKKTKDRVGTAFIAEEFFLDSETQKYSSYMPDMEILVTALHELGHTTGGSRVKKPQEHFSEEYSSMEEARAELFSMWTLPSLVKQGMISEKQEIAGYYNMLQNMIKSLDLKPIDHGEARNMMFHYFLKNSALIEREENGKVKYLINLEKMRHAVKNMIGTIGDIKAEGDVGALKRFKVEYVSSEQQEYFKNKMAEMPLGTGLIFPTLKRKYQGIYTGELIYPKTFRDQKRTLEHFI